MQHYKADYYERRAAKQRRLAGSAATEAVVLIHFELAQQYDELAARASEISARPVRDPVWSIHR